MCKNHHIIYSTCRLLNYVRKKLFLTSQYRNTSKYFRIFFARESDLHFSAHFSKRLSTAYLNRSVSRNQIYEIYILIPSFIILKTYKTDKWITFTIS